MVFKKGRSHEQKNPQAFYLNTVQARGFANINEDLSHCYSVTVIVYSLTFPCCPYMVSLLPTKAILYVPGSE